MSSAFTPMLDGLTRQLVAVGDVLRGLDHAYVGVTGQQRQIGRAAGPRPHGVKDELCTAGTEGLFSLHEGEPRPTHGFDTSADPDTELASCDRVGELDGRRER